ncbi:MULTISPECIES: amidohydrolase family protein [Actinosynnema]|uniref:Amidohydrolase n=1 Tax=Actinosynnema pretiosum TaxID=42197 RepID=A0A290YZP9_9PSEU|nr:amidohydrolase family protein [Actinosynnema pretiosum]ATE52224.1 amidohydrolase [Actinosynnema pretiosum]
MIVDAHHHVWDLAVRDQPWITGRMSAIRRDFTVHDLARAAPEVTTTVLVQTAAGPAETPELLALADREPLVGAVVGWLDLTGDVPAQLAALRALPGARWLRGVRHQVQAEHDPDWLIRPDVLRGLAAVAAGGLVYELLTLPHQLPAARRAAAALPQLTFVLDHCSKPPVGGDLREWAAEVRALAARPNVLCKLSGLVTEADWANWSVADLRPVCETVLEAFGPRRLMFGSDWPVCLLAASHAEVLAAARELTADLSGAERTALFSTTATLAYRL